MIFKNIALKASALSAVLALTGCVTSNNSHLDSVAINGERINISEIKSLKINASDETNELILTDSKFGALIHNDRQYFYAQGNKTEDKNIPLESHILYNGKIVLGLDANNIIKRVITGLEKQKGKPFTQKERDEIIKNFSFKDTIITLPSKNMVNFDLNFAKKNLKIKMNDEKINKSVSLSMNSSSAIIIDGSKFFSTNLTIVFNYNDNNFKFKLPITFSLLGQFNGISAQEISGTITAESMKGIFGAAKPQN